VTTSVGECPECGFDPHEWNDLDTARTLARADYLWGHALAGLPDPLRAAADALAGATPAVGGETDERDAVHRLLHHCRAVAELRAGAGDLPPVQHGRVAQVNASGGGVPKLPVSEALVGRRGVAGDRQRVRRHHGRPWQALCLWSADVIAALATEGHPIAPGAAGENVTVEGVDWSVLRSGLVVELGTVRCRLTVPAEPCANISRWFAPGTGSRRIDHDRHPGWSRWYAAVESGGVVRPGDRVVVALR